MESLVKASLTQPLWSLPPALFNPLFLDLSLFAQEDLPFFHLMLTLLLHKIMVSTPDPTH